MLPAFPAVYSLEELLLEINELLVVSVSAFNMISPAGAAPLVSACIIPPPPNPVLSVMLTVWAVMAIVAGLVEEFPPAIVVLMVLLSRLTLVAGLPGPVTPWIVMFPAFPAAESPMKKGKLELVIRE